MTLVYHTQNALLFQKINLILGFVMMIPLGSFKDLIYHYIFIRLNDNTINVFDDNSFTYSINYDNEDLTAFIKNMDFKCSKRFNNYI